MNKCYILLKCSIILFHCFHIQTDSIMINAIDNSRISKVHKEEYAEL